jgi:hypothetical protein
MTAPQGNADARAPALVAVHSRGAPTAAETAREHVRDELVVGQQDQQVGRSRSGDL